MDTGNFQLEHNLQKYLTCLEIEKNCSFSTLFSYRTEFQKFIYYLDGKIK